MFRNEDVTCQLFAWTAVIYIYVQQGSEQSMGFYLLIQHTFTEQYPKCLLVLTVCLRVRWFICVHFRLHMYKLRTIVPIARLV